MWLATSKSPDFDPWASSYQNGQHAPNRRRRVLAHQHNQWHTSVSHTILQTGQRRLVMEGQNETRHWVSNQANQEGRARSLPPIRNDQQKKKTSGKLQSDSKTKALSARSRASSSPHGVNRTDHAIRVISKNKTSEKPPPKRPCRRTPGGYESQAKIRIHPSHNRSSKKHQDSSKTMI